MKRYRVLGFDFDTRATILSLQIEENWEDEVKRLHRDNKNKIIKGLKHEFGKDRFDEKLRNFIDLGPKPISVIAFHNKFFDQIRRAFVMGCYYPALIAACALGERILNHLILKLRDDFRHTDEYKKVHSKDSFDNWDLAIDTLESWGILLESVAIAFRNLRDMRHRAIHFNPEIDSNDRELALKSIRELDTIISSQFGVIGAQPWFIEGCKGASYIKKEYEPNPFVRDVYLPNSALVGPKHKLDIIEKRFIVLDDNEYEDRDIKDEEFLKLVEESRSR